MNLVLKFILCSVLFVCASLFACSSGQVAWSQDQPQENKAYWEDDSWLLRFIHTVGDQPDKFEYFLKEIELSSEQRQTFLFDVKQYMKQMKEAHQELRELHKRSFFDKSEALKQQIKRLEPKPDQLGVGIIAKLKKTLLDHQLIRMRQAIIQRVHLQTTIESFQLPLYLKALEMTPGQKTKLKANIDEVTGEFNQEKAKLRLETWKKILSDLPKEISAETIELLNLNVEKK